MFIITVISRIRAYSLTNIDEKADTQILYRASVTKDCVTAAGMKSRNHCVTALGKSVRTSALSVTPSALPANRRLLDVLDNRQHMDGQDFQSKFDRQID